MFKTVESFRKQLDNVMSKVEVADLKLALAGTKLAEAKLAVRRKADEIRGEADALIVRANQINNMLDAIGPGSDPEW